MKQRPWLFFALVTTLFWGVWGAFIEIPEKAGFPATLGYCVWAITMIPCAVVALRMVNWRLDRDRRSVGYGAIVGFSGAGGQLILFLALQKGPAYIVFPVISLYPVVTVLLSIFYLKESATRKHWAGIVLALLAIAFLSYMKPSGQAASGVVWLVFAILVFLLWGLQAFVMKFSNESMKAESIFFYMTVTGVLLMPLAIAMTDFSRPVNWGLPNGCSLISAAVSAAGSSPSPSTDTKATPSGWAIRAIRTRHTLTTVGARHRATGRAVEGAHRSIRKGRCREPVQPFSVRAFPVRPSFVTRRTCGADASDEATEDGKSPQLGPRRWYA